MTQADYATGVALHISPTCSEPFRPACSQADSAPLRRPLFLNPVAAGFPSPADDYIERTLDLNELLIRNAPATFFVRAQGDSMLGAGIHDGDILVVDRSISPAHNRVVIAAVHGELTVKRLWVRGGRTVLQPENPAYRPLDVTAMEDAHIWGVVTSVIHPL